MPRLASALGVANAIVTRTTSRSDLRAQAERFPFAIFKALRKRLFNRICCVYTALQQDAIAVSCSVGCCSFTIMNLNSINRSGARRGRPVRLRGVREFFLSHSPVAQPLALQPLTLSGRELNAYYSNGCSAAQTRTDAPPSTVVLNDLLIDRTMIVGMTTRAAHMASW